MNIFNRLFDTKKEQVGNPQESEQAKMPEGHKSVDEKDKDKCPYFQINSKLNKNDESKDIEKSPLVNEKKQKRPKGGCPFMVSDKKKNPPLGPMEELYDTAFVSPYQYLFEYRGILSMSLDFNEEEYQRYQKREQFEQYPIYLKHTLIHEDEDMKKVRGLEVASRFFVYDKFRERGNKEFYKGEYDNALAYYERALGCFRWLEYKELEPLPKNQDKQDEAQQEEEEKKVDENESEVTQRYIKDLPTLTEAEQEQFKQLQEQLKKEKEEMKTKYKTLMKTYCDENVTLKDGEELTESSDIDMRRSMVQTILMMICIAYMKLGHFKLAQMAIDDAMKIHDKSSQLYYRKSQALSYNKSATVEELLEAKDCIEKAIHMKQYEKVFQSEKGILKIMNLENHEEAYIEQAQFATRRLHERKSWEIERLRKVMAREKQLQEIEQRMLSEGKTPISIQKARNGEIQDEIDEEQLMPWEIVSEMVRKYYRAVEFYNETQKPDQVKLAKAEIQQTLAIFREMEYYYHAIDFSNPNDLILLINQDFQIDLKESRFVKRMQRLARDNAKAVFESGKFNFEMYKYAIENYFQKRQEEREKREKEQKEQEEQLKPAQKQSARFKLFSLESFAQIIVILMLMVTFFYFNKDTQFFKNFIFPIFDASKKN